MCIALLAAPEAVAAAPAPAAPAAPAWEKSYQAAREKARKTRRPLLVDFFADWCGPCKQMDQTTFRDPEVLRLLKRYVPVRLNLDKEEKLARQFGIESIPHVVILDPDGKVTQERIGYQAPAAFRLFLLQALPG